MHLVVVQHGLWGSSGNTAHLSLLLRERLGQGHFILNSDVNGGNLTYDGIDVCGDRLFALVVSTIDSLANGGNPVKAISLIGYSMGGLITRYVAGKLYAEGHFQSITPVNFITVATPHLGAWRMPSSWYNRAFNYMVPVVTSRSGYQLVLQDKHVWGKPLMCLLSHPDLLFMSALRRFKKLMLLANVFHDRPVPYCTAAIRLDNPYEASPPVPIDPKYPSIVMTAAERAAKAVAAAAPAKTATQAAAAAPSAATTEAASVTVPDPNEQASAKDAEPSPTRSPAAIESQGVGPKPASNGPAAGAGGGAAAGVAAAATTVTVLAEGTAAATGYDRGCTTGGDGDGGPTYGAGLSGRQTEQQPGPDPGVDSTAAEESDQSQQQQQHQQPPPLRPLRSTYLRYLMILFLPLALPALLLMVITGRSHHSKITRTALDFSWIQQYHDRHGACSDGDCGGGGGDDDGHRKHGPRHPAAASGSGGDDVYDLKRSGGAGGGRMPSDIECPSAPDLPALASASSAAAKIAAPAGSSGGGGGGVVSFNGGGGAAAATAAPASATALGALDDGADGVVVSEQSVLLHDGIVELPAELHRVQEWLVEQLNKLPWHKVDVDCRDYHAHAAIIMRNPARFTHNRDVLDFLIDQFLRV